MSDEKKAVQENNFKFGLYLTKERSEEKILSEEVVYERIFTADVYNPVVRYSVNIKKMIPSIISNLQARLQGKGSITFTDDFGYNSLESYVDSVNGSKGVIVAEKLYSPKPTTIPNPNIKYKGVGVEFTFRLYINNNTIVERFFYVDNYIPETRFSNEFHEVLGLIVKSLISHMKNTDTNNMWAEYDLINTYELNIQQVRELTPEKREVLLKRMNDYSFVEKIKIEYNKYPVDYLS